MRVHSTLSTSRLEQPDEEDFALAELDQDDASANDRTCEALIALRERKGLALDVWAKKLGLTPHELRKIEDGRVLDQPSASLLLRAAHLAGGELKIGFSGRQPIKV